MKAKRMYKTEWFRENDCRFRFEWGYNYCMGNSSSHVTITEEAKWNDGGWSFGKPSVGHLLRFADHLLPIYKWDGCFIDSGPMHYIANAKYWWEMIHGRDQLKSWYRKDDPSNRTPEEAREIFLKHILYGYLESDGIYDPVLMTIEELGPWLQGRLQELIALLRKECDPIVGVS